MRVIVMQHMILIVTWMTLSLKLMELMGCIRVSLFASKHVIMF